MAVASGSVWTIRGMGQNFIACDREQELLLPPSLREWLPEGHLARFVIDAVAELDLATFYVAYRHDGHGRPAHDPAMMVALLLYSYALGERSSRRIERGCSVRCSRSVPSWFGRGRGACGRQHQGARER